MNLMYFKESSLEVLKNNILNNIDMYKKDEPWISEFFKEEEFSLPTAISVRDVELRIPLKPTEHYDIENTKLLYEAMSDLTIPQATDERLWAYLTHVTFWEYMRSRWDVGRLKEDADFKTVIKSRYFISGNANNALVRNGIARLWWYGHVSYEKSMPNPFALTEMLLATQDIAQNLMERSFSRNPVILKGILRVLYERKKNNHGIPSVDKFRELSKTINRIGGITILDTLDENDIEKIVADSLVG